MATPIDFCNRCSAHIYAEDGVPGGCGCPDGQLKQLLASIRAPKVVASPKPVLAPASRIPFTMPAPMQRTASQPLVNDEMLQGLWSAEPGDEDLGVTASVETSGLESLWMGRVASETGQYGGSGVDLESLWMNELSTERGTTVSTPSNEISFDDDGIDSELAQYRGGPRGGSASAPRTRVDRAPAWTPRQYPVMEEARTITVRSTDRTASIREIRQRAIEQVHRPERPVPTRRSAEARAIEYASRPTVYQRLMRDDD